METIVDLRKIVDQQGIVNQHEIVDPREIIKTCIDIFKGNELCFFNFLYVTFIDGSHIYFDKEEDVVVKEGIIQTITVYFRSAIDFIVYNINEKIFFGCNPNLIEQKYRILYYIEIEKLHNIDLKKIINNKKIIKKINKKIKRKKNHLENIFKPDQSGLNKTIINAILKGSSFGLDDYFFNELWWQKCNNESTINDKLIKIFYDLLKENNELKIKLNLTSDLMFELNKSNKAVYHINQEYLTINNMLLDKIGRYNLDVESNYNLSNLLKKTLNIQDPDLSPHIHLGSRLGFGNPFELDIKYLNKL